MPAAKTEKRPEALSKALDRLYGAPLDQFIALRRELAGALRASRELPASRQVAAAAKPTRTAWALNQVARTHPELLRDLFEVRDRAAATQRSSDAEQVRTAVREYRECVTEVVRAARNALASVGIEMSSAQSRRIGETLQAAGTGDNDVRASVLAGRLALDVDVEDSVAGLEAGVALSPGLREKGDTGDSPARGGERLAQRRQAGDQITRQRADQIARRRALERERLERQRAIDKAAHRVALLEKQALEADALATASEASAKLAQTAALHARRAAEQAGELLERARAEMQALMK